MFNWLAEMFEVGGYVVMISILLVLVLSLIIVVERSYRYWFQYDLGNTSMFMAAIQKAIMNNSIENAIRNCKHTRYRSKLVPYVIKEGLKRANDTTEEIDNSLERATLTTRSKVTRRLSFLGTTANVATLLGLLGTLSGLMHSFGAAAEMTGEDKQTELAAGISEALVATSFGLSVALLCLLAFGVLQMKQNNILDDLAKSSAALNELLFTRKMKLKKN